MMNRVIEDNEEVAGEDASVYADIARRMSWWMHRPFANRIVSAGVHSGCVLDVGCGPGYLATYLASSAAEAKIWAMDISPEMLTLVGERAMQNGLSRRIIPVHGDMKSLPFAPASFDAVVSSFALHHLADVGRGIDELLRVLRPGGAFVVKDLVRPASLARAKWLVEFFGTILGYSAAAKKQYFDSLCAGLSRSDLIALAEEKGLELEFLPLSCFHLIRRAQAREFEIPDTAEVWSRSSVGVV